MAIYFDTLNNYFLGDVKNGNADMAYPTISYTTAEKLTGNNINSQIASICSTLGLSYTISGDWSFPNGINVNETLSVTPVGDDINNTYGRKRFEIKFFNNGLTVNGFDNFNLFGVFGKTSQNGEGAFFANTNEYSAIFERQVAGVFSNRGVALCFMRREITDPTRHRYIFIYVGTLEDVQLPMFDSTYLGKSIIFVSSNYGTPAVDTANGWHYVVPLLQARNVLSSGSAFYNIVCADSQVPSANQLTEFYVKYNDSALNYPAIGKLKNVMYAQGTYLLGKPVKIAQTPYPDTGHNHWLPVAYWGTYTLLMRCYSSIV